MDIIQAEYILSILTVDPNNRFLTGEGIVVSGLQIKGQAFIQHNGFGKLTHPVIFRGCKFSNQVTISSFNLIDSIQFEDCVFEEGLEVVKSISENGSLKFKGTTRVKKSILLNGSDSPIALNEIEIDGNIILTGEYKEVNIYNVNEKRTDQFHSHLILDKFKVGVFLADSIKFKLIEVRTTNHISLSIKRFIGHNIDISSTSELSLSLRDSSLHSIVYDRIENKNIRLDLEHCKFIFQVCPLDYLINSKISDCEFSFLEIKGYNKKDNYFNIEKSKFNGLRFEDVTNEGLISLKELIPLRKLNPVQKPLFQISSSNLGKTDFINCDLTSTIFKFENSRITDVFLAVTDFPEIVDGNDKKSSLQGQLAFGQLSSASQKQGDTVRSLEYQAREIHAHFRGLHFFSRDFFKAFSMGLNLVSNYFGRWWFCGMAFTITIGVIFFYLLVISSDQYEFAWTIDWDDRFFTSFCKFMNPLRFYETENLFKLSSQEPYLSLTGKSYLTDFFGRVFTAYGFYQTIQAFRRFGRK